MSEPCYWPGCANARLSDIGICEAHVQVVVAFARRRDERRAERTAQAPSPPSTPPKIDLSRQCVYYLQVGDRIKVGHATLLHRRLREYPPNAVLLAAEPGDRSLERQRHRELSPWLADGREWFFDVPEVRQKVDEVLAQNGPPKVWKPRVARAHQQKRRSPVTTRRVES